MTFDEQPPAGVAHRRGAGEPPEGEPQRLHRVGHHLLVADGDVDAGARTVGLGDREQRGDGPGLHDVDVPVREAPFDVLRVAHVGFDPPPQRHEAHHLGVREDWVLPSRRFDRPADDLAVADRVDVRRHEPGHQRVAESDAGLHRGNSPAPAHRVGREQDAGRTRDHEPLHDHGHVDRPMSDAVADPVGDRTIGEQRRPAPTDVRNDRVRTGHAEEAVVLAGERRRGQVLRGGAGAHGAGHAPTEAGNGPGDGRHEIGRHRNLVEHRPDPGAQRADRLLVVWRQVRQLLEPLAERWRTRDDPPEGVRRHDEPVRYPDAADPHQLPEVGTLATRDRGLCPVEFLELHHVTAQPRSSPHVVAACWASRYRRSAALVARRAALA